MRLHAQLDPRSWWVGFYVNTVYRELHICILVLVITIARRHERAVATQGALAF